MKPDPNNPITWTDDEWPIFEGVYARPAAAGGTANQERAFRRRVQWRKSTKLGAPVHIESTPVSPAPAPAPVVPPDSGKQVVSLFGNNYLSGYVPAESGDMEGLYSGNSLVSGSTAIVPATGIDENDAKTWPDSRFPVFNNVVARPKAAGGNAQQHKAHIDRLEYFKGTGKTAAKAPSEKGWWSELETWQQIGIIAAPVAIVGGLYWYTHREKTGIAGYIQRGRRMVGI